MKGGAGRSVLKSHMGQRPGPAIGKRIAQVRQARSLTQAELASVVGLDRTALAKVESGRRRVSAQEIRRLAGALNQPLKWLLADDDESDLDLSRLRRLRSRILEVASRHGATNVRVFGSLARGEGDNGSDVDFLLDMEPDHSLFDRAALVVELAEVLGRRVDVATPQALRDRLRDRVLREAVKL